MTAHHDVIVYSLEICPNCEILKDYLNANEILYTEWSMDDPEILTDLRMDGVFAREAPVLRIGSRYLTSGEIFDVHGVKASIATLCRR